MNRIQNWKSVVAVLALFVGGTLAEAQSCDHQRTCDSAAKTTIAFVSQISPEALPESDLERTVSATNSTLSAELVWSPTVNELAWSEIQPSTIDKAWLDSDYLDTSGMSEDHAVARGLADVEPAIQVATNKHILPRLRKYVRLEPWSINVARTRITSELQRSSIIVDEFSQTFYRSVGDEQLPAFTREALLLDLSDKNIKSLARSVDHAIHRNQRVRSGAFKFAFAAVAITCVVCWIVGRFLNRLTQGYYVWPIRLATGMVLLVSFGLTARIALTILQAL
jgi:hypothetical protein